MKKRVAALSIIAFGASMALLVPLTCILLYGTHTIHEPILPILILEVVVVFSFIAYSLYCIVKISEIKKEGG